MPLTTEVDHASFCDLVLIHYEIPLCELCLDHLKTRLLSISFVFLWGFDAKLNEECISSIWMDILPWDCRSHLYAFPKRYGIRSVSQAIYVFHAFFFFSCAFKASLKKSTWTEAPWIFEKSPTGVFPGKALCLLNTFTYFLFFSEKVQICKPSQILLLFLIGVKN